jgi:hypothetical protein
MREKEFRILVRACTRAAPGSTRNARRIQGRERASVVRAEFDGFLGGIFAHAENLRNKVDPVLQPHLLVFDLGLLQVCDLAHFGLMNRRRRHHVLWPGHTLPSRPSRASVLYLLLSNLAHSLQAFRLLLAAGFEGQARIVLRSFLELADLTTGVINDPKIYRDYIQQFDEEKDELTHWWRNLSPKAIRKRLAQLRPDPLATPSGLIDAHDLRASTYSWLSGFTHGNFISHIVSATKFTDLGPSIGGPGGMLGGIGYIGRASLESASLSLWVFLDGFNAKVLETHEWARFQTDRDLNLYFERARIYNELFHWYRDNIDLGSA